MTGKVRDTDDYPTEPFKDFQHKQEYKKRPYFARLNALLDIILKGLAVFLTVVPLGIFIFFVIVEFKRNTVIIDDFEVPKEIQEQGYTSRVFVKKLLDQIAFIKETSSTVLTQDITSTPSLKEAIKTTSIREIPTITFIKETPKTTWKSPEFLTVDNMSEIEVKIPGSIFSDRKSVV